MATKQSSNGFIQPSKEAKTNALGPTDQLKADIHSALTVSIDESFPDIPIPSPSDWLYEQFEPGQTVEQFQRSKKIQPSQTCNIIYIQPLGDFNTPRAPDLQIICDFSQIFFPGCQTELLPPVDFEKGIKKRTDGFTNQPQYLVSGIIAQLKKMQRKRKNHRELLCVGVTMMDIYPGPGWNFVYGSASMDEGLGIYSFARLDPLFFELSSGTATKAHPLTNAERKLILRRAVSTYVHEVIHLFGLEHCIYYSCLMNGANNEKEMDASLLYLCPVCLRKMHISFQKFGFNVITMYEDLFHLSRKVGFELEEHWYEQRLALLSSH